MRETLPNSTQTSFVPWRPHCLDCTDELCALDWCSLRAQLYARQLPFSVLAFWVKGSPLHTGAFHVAPPTSRGPWKMQENLYLELMPPVQLRPHPVITWEELQAGGRAERGQATSCP